jgi:hypothetical protein
MITNEMRPHFSSSRHKEITLLIAQLSALKPMYSLRVSIIVSANAVHLPRNQALNRTQKIEQTGSGTWAS